MSEKYSFLPAIQVVDALAKEGLTPYQAKQSYTRIEGKAGFTKHSLRVRLPQSEMQNRFIGMVTPEIVLTNSHDRGSSFIVELGLFRLVCLNGMVVSSGNLENFRVRHVGSTVEDILNVTAKLVAQFPLLASQVDTFQSIQLTDERRQHLAELAMGLRYDADKVPFPAARLLAIRREADRGASLWNTFNVIQENLIKRSEEHTSNSSHGGISRMPSSA